MKFVKSKLTELAVPLIVGISAYAFIIRFHGFWPTDVGWMLPQWNGNIDAASHYIGWEMYRQSDLLQWPIGRSPMLGPDGGSSIAYSTLPLLALIFKPFTHWLKIPLQFFGFWSLVCFIGQSISSWKLLGLWIKNRIHLSIGVCFFVIAPSFLDRLSVHFDASAHWLLIFALYMFFRPNFKFGQWLILGALSVLIFPYIAMMVSFIFATRLIVDGIHTKGWFEVIKRISIYVGVLLITAWQCGFFLLGGSKIDAEGYGVFSANALTFVDPGYPDNYRAPWSHVIPDQWQGPGQYEGFSFVGAGILLLAATVWILKIVRGSRSTRAILIAPVVCISVLFGRFQDLTQLKLTILLGILVAIAFENIWLYKSDRLMLKIAAALSFVLMTLFAFSNQILLGIFQITKFRLSPTLMTFANIFRSSGRFAWPLMYVLIALIIVALIGELPKALITPILLVALAFQVIDSNNGTQFTTDAYSRAGPESYLTSQTWDLLGKKYDGVLFSPAANKPRLFMSVNADFLAENGVLWRDIGVLAQKYNWSMNSSYFSRDPANKFQKDNTALDLSLVNGSFDLNVIYAFIGNDQWERAKLIAGRNDLVGILDGVPILAPNFYPCVDCLLDGFVDRHSPG
jgi:hypothetical protein